jgi:hypothetical protein
MLTFVGALVAVVVAIAGAAISFFQWRTAQQKVVLDIFADRYAIYKDLRAAVSMFLQNVNFSAEVQQSYMDAQSRARFYFGAEVDSYLETLRLDMIRGHFFDRYEYRHEINADAQVERLNRVAVFDVEIDRMFIPYMRINQRMPLWWWSDFLAVCKRVRR